MENHYQSQCDMCCLRTDSRIIVFCVELKQDEYFLLHMHPISSTKILQFFWPRYLFYDLNSKINKFQ